MQRRNLRPAFARAHVPVEDAVRYMNENEEPLAIYYFGQTAPEQKYILERTTSGALVINDVMSHAFAESLPFGGVGASGMGAYHGRFGFERFSHAKPVFIQSPRGESNLLMRPPYGTTATTTLDAQIGAKAEVVDTKKPDCSLGASGLKRAGMEMRG
jgi:coniferyl-aldehyde dehydrogenase